MSDAARTYSLAVWADDDLVGTVSCDPMTDQWRLEYSPSWIGKPTSFPLSPALPFDPSASGYAIGAVKRFVENLLPEGGALEVASTTYRVSKSNVFGLITALGSETTGAFRFSKPGEALPSAQPSKAREVTREELDQRLSERDTHPLAVWDGKVRMSIAGVQDKLMVYVDRPLEEGGRMFLVEPPLASTHIIKPEPGRAATPHLVINEHFCMSLAARMGLPAAEVSIFRTPRPTLVVKRFDRSVLNGSTGPAVRRLHIIDACQASDLPSTYKYERNFGSGAAVRDIREGVSLEVLFSRVDQTVNKAAARLTLLRWTLYQFLIGNSDAHGKNFSFFVRPQGLEPAPWYDLVSVTQYPAIDHELAMAFGDAFTLNEVGAFQLADFAQRCGIDRRLLKREAARLAKLAIDLAPTQAKSDLYLDGEKQFAAGLCEFVVQQASRMTTLANEAATIKAEYL